ncbi:MAG TPA: 4-hydroxythreonine-4-phosphate dehydrogenase PdxA [Pirellulaceae bacterium]|jgi:4-hydroxythreonine-4-phosphate dehydrogenase|nr:4-hydroxythreonine-4-phosphate dehydrogenase PdxA [Pirellulaceae bacterium]
MDRPRIALTMGDPAGVGPEVCLHALASAEVAAVCTPIVFGDAETLALCAERTGLPAPSRVISPDELDSVDAPAALDLKALATSGFEPGRISAATGRAAYTYVERAIDAALAGQVAAVSTGPLNKEAMHLAGIRFPGHTEIFASRTNAARSCMMQYSEEITCTFVTVHVGYRDVPALLTKERIVDVIELTAAGLLRIRGRRPKIVVCGLNPHAGEHGLFGDREEERIIVPAIEAARELGHDVEGPLPPDTAFLPWKRRSTDAFVCMYHDQGHIPVKALAFDSAVNTTLGLPIVRTSVDHGTALDIAWQGKANPGSLFAALRLAAKLAS